MLPEISGCRSPQRIKSIRFDGWGGIVSEAFRKYAFEPFTEATGIKVIDSGFGDMNMYLTRVKASFPPGGEYNLAHLGGGFHYSRFVNLGFGVELDETRIPNLNNVMEPMITPFRTISGGTLSAAPFDLGRTGIAYNTNYISKEDIEHLGVNILWEKSLSGKIGSLVDWVTNVWYGALRTGQYPNGIQDIETVWNALSQQREIIKKYWVSGAELMSLLANEEIYVTPAWSGRVAALQEQGHPIGFFAPKNCYSWQECIFVIKGTDLDIAHTLLNFLLEPSCAIAVAEAQKYPPSLDPQKVDLPETVTGLPAFDPSGTLEDYLFADADYWNEHEVEWAEKWDRIRVGG